MTVTFSKTIQVHSPDETALLAEQIAPTLKAGDVLFLEGEIGAGKTHFARALIQARLKDAGLFEDVPSPTFTLVQTYDDGKAEIWHADLYRLTDPQEITELGLEDAFRNEICLVEWPKNLGIYGPDHPLVIRFENGTAEESRNLHFSGNPAFWEAIMPILNQSSVVKQ